MKLGGCGLSEHGLLNNLLEEAPTTVLSPCLCPEEDQVCETNSTSSAVERHRTFFDEDLSSGVERTRKKRYRNYAASWTLQRFVLQYDCSSIGLRRFIANLVNNEWSVW